MKTNLLIELLEPRIAPAAVVINAPAKMAQWTDFDGDRVTLKWSTNAPQFSSTDHGEGLIVDAVKLYAPTNSHESFTLSVKQGPHGDGQVDLGRIAAPNVPLKSWISPSASIAEFDCGNTTDGIGALNIGSLGALAANNFPMSGGNGGSLIEGAVSTVTLHGDLGASLLLNGSGVMKSMVISGSVRGTAGLPGVSGGQLGIYGASLGSLAIGGSVIGGGDDNDGRVTVYGALGKLTVKGGIYGGTGDYTGYVDASPKVASIGGSIQGSTGQGSGKLAVRDVSSLIIGGNISGGAGSDSGSVYVRSAATISIKGNIQGTVFDSGAQPVGAVGLLQVETFVKSLTLGGDLLAGHYFSGERPIYNGAISVGWNVGTLTIHGSILGNADTSALIAVQGLTPATPGNFNAIGKLRIDGSVTQGYIAAGHGKVSSAATKTVDAVENADAGIGSVTVGGDWFHSNLTAGVTDLGSNGFTSGDTHEVGDAARLAVLGPVVIKGRLLDDSSVPGFSGFAADKIASIIVHGAKVFKTGDPAHSLDFAGFVDVKEFA